MTYINENNAVSHCDSSRESIYSSESISVFQSDRTYIYKIDSNEPSIETLNSSIETSFDADGSEIPLYLVMSQIVWINLIWRLVILTHLYMPHQVLTHIQVC